MFITHVYNHGELFVFQIKTDPLQDEVDSGFQNSQIWTEKIMNIGK